MCGVKGWMSEGMGLNKVERETGAAEGGGVASTEGARRRPSLETCLVCLPCAELRLSVSDTM